MIANDKPFTSTPFSTNSNLSIPPTIQDLLEILNNILIINDDSTENYSVVSLPGEHKIDSTVLDQKHTSVTNLPVLNNLSSHNTEYKKYIFGTSINGRNHENGS